jgi:hypothetical protein
MGKGGGGRSAPPPQPTQQTVNQTNLPEYARPYFENIMQRAQAESYRPYTPYGGERIAGFTPGQVAAQQETFGMQTPGQFGVGTGMTGAGGIGALGLGAQASGAGQQYMGMATSPAAQQAFMSPYMQNVVDVQKQEAIRDAQKGLLGQNLAAARQGTYGGARQTLAQTERERGLQSQLAQIQAAGSQKAFEAAQQAQQFGSQLGLQGLQTGIQGFGQAIQAGQTLGQLGAQQQQTDLARIQAQAAAGAEQQALQQQRLDTAYADFLRQRDYPMEQLGYYSNLLRGIPVQLGSTQTTYAQPPSMISQVGGLGLAGLGLYNLSK